MSTKIKVLSEKMANLIAAGEVIERPASVVKELLENSLDAQAQNIVVKVNKGGTQLISVKDDGDGMSPDDALLCLERHATSKIAKPEDLNAIATLGFRGEALPSIAVVSQMKLITREKSQMMGTEITIEGGKIKQVKEAGCPVGTRIDIQNLFFNTPARRKFLKSEENELFHITAHLERIAIAYPQLSLTFFHNEQQVKFYPAVSDIKTRIISALDAAVENYLLPVDFKDDYCQINGFITTPDYQKNNRQYQLVYLNNRCIKSNTIDFAITQAYGPFIERGKYPLVVLFIKISPQEVDVNVHPTKREIRFRKDFEIKKRVALALNNALAQKGAVPQVVFEETSPDNILFSPLKDSSETIETTQLKVNYQYNDYKYVTYKVNSEADKFTVTSLKDQKRHQAYRILGVIADFYLIVEYEAGFYIIDQHAAHERVIYERVRAAFANGPLESQYLMYPNPLELPTSKIKLLNAHRDIIEKFGFVIETLGPESYFVKAVPALLKDMTADYCQLIYDIIDEIALHETSTVAEKIIQDIVATIACHSAIKAAQDVPLPILESIVVDLFACENPYRCPHGRPTIIRMTLDELAKKFKRK